MCRRLALLHMYSRKSRIREFHDDVRAAMTRYRLRGGTTDIVSLSKNGFSALAAAWAVLRYFSRNTDRAACRRATLHTRRGIEERNQMLCGEVR
jgi:hypothetical protein